MLGLLHLSFNIRSCNRFSCSINFFHLKIALGQILDVACATTEKHLCPASTFSYFRGKAFLGKPAKVTFVETKDASFFDANCNQSCHMLVYWTQLSQHTCWAMNEPRASRAQTQQIAKNYLFASFGWKVLVRKPSKITFRRQQGCCPEKALSFSAQLTTQEVAMCWHMLAFYIQPFPPFIRAMALCQGARGWKRGFLSADTLDKSQEAPLPNPRSISLGNLWLPKCTAQLPSLNLVNRMYLSNSDFDIQSAGYNSAQSPTNWESFHGKDPSILCRLSSRLSIALDDKDPKGEIQDCGLTTNLLDTKCL